MAIVYKPRNIYSEDAYGDSFSPSYLHQVSSSYLTYGSFSSYDNLDYYYINATAGNYKLTVTTEGLSNVYNNNIRMVITRPEPSYYHSYIINPLNETIKRDHRFKGYSNDISPFYN